MDSFIEFFTWASTYFWQVLLLLYVLTGILTACLCHSLSKGKQYESNSGHTALGFFFGIFGLIYTAGLPDLGVRAALGLSEASHAGVGSTHIDRTGQSMEPDDAALIAVISAAVARYRETEENHGPDTGFVVKRVRRI